MRAFERLGIADAMKDKLTFGAGGPGRPDRPLPGAQGDRDRHPADARADGGARHRHRRARCPRACSPSPCSPAASRRGEKSGRRKGAAAISRHHRRPPRWSAPKGWRSMKACKALHAVAVAASRDVRRRQRPRRRDRGADHHRHEGRDRRTRSAVRARQRPYLESELRPVRRREAAVRGRRAGRSHRVDSKLLDELIKQGKVRPAAPTSRAPASASR